MDELVEWHIGGSVLQLVTDVEHAGGSLLRLQVDALSSGDRKRTSSGPDFRTERHPDGNAITPIAA